MSVLGPEPVFLNVYGAQEHYEQDRLKEKQDQLQDEQDRLHDKQDRQKRVA
jgi:hypothetical protein